MATVYRYSLCYWKNAQNNYTARMVDDGFAEAVVVAETAKEAISQLKKYLAYLHKEADWAFYDPDFSDPQLRFLKFSVVPEYRTEKRRYPSKEPMRFRMPCITGVRDEGTPIAFFPTLGRFFDYHSDDNFETLGVHMAQQALSNLTPQELTRFLAPTEIEIETVTVTLKDEAAKSNWEKQLRPLSDIADPMGEREFRRIAKTWERENEVTAIANLLREPGANLCIVGESGSGKSSALIEAARRVERELPASEVAGRRHFWMTSAPRLIAGMRFLGQWEERVESVIRQISGLPGVLCFESLTELVSLGGQSPESSIAAFLQPYLANGELRIVVEATPSELDACDRKLPGLIDQLQIVKLDPFDTERARRVCQRAAEHFTQNDKVTFTASEADRVYDLFHRFQPYVAFPGKVIQFMGSVVDTVIEEDSTSRVVTSEKIEAQFTRDTGLPEFLVRGDGGMDHRDLLSHFQEKLIGQSEAIETTTRVVTKFAAGLNDPKRPIGVLLFCGPTGVGKTQLVRLLGEYLFPNRPERDRVIRLDMSEYSGYDAAERLLGAATGGPPSDLVRRVRARPFSVVLLDEIEKASEEVFDTFLSVFEEGRLTDSLGRLTHFNSSLIVMTSNLGAGGSGAVGFGSGGGDSVAKGASAVDQSAVLNFFRPEFFNRIDQTVYFNALGRESIEHIARIELSAIAKREGLQTRGLTLEIDERVVIEVAKTGFDPVYGARPLQRAVEDLVAAPLARWLIEAQQRDLRERAIQVTWSDTGIEFTSET